MSVDLDGIGFSIKGTRIKLFSPGKTVTLNVPTASVANVSTSSSVECRPNTSIVLLNMAGEVVMTWTKEHLELLVEHPAVEKYWELKNGSNMAQSQLDFTEFLKRIHWNNNFYFGFLCSL